ncbi:MAG: sucrase ferredoxin [Acidimicrobiia bacterium]
MTSGGPRCSAEALDRDEPLYATASLVASWLLIEQPGAWGPDAITESRFPQDVAAELQRRAGDVRILLIRHREESDRGPVFFKAHSGGVDSGPSLVSSPLPDPLALLDVDMEALSRGDTGPGTVVEHPIYLVCTHGRHDICCADKGRPLYRAMSAARPDRTWEVSHLGGDRFAGNLLVLPRGDYFGRVEPDEGEPLVAAYEMGRLDVAHHRGRSIQPRLAQAAEHFLRETEGLEDFGALVVTDYRRTGHDEAQVSFQGLDARYEVQVTARRAAERAYLTCRADEPGFPVIYELSSITRS